MALDQTIETFWVIYECDPWESYDSHTIKAISTNEELIRSEFDRFKEEYVRKNPDQWFLKLATYEQASVVSLDGNILRDLEEVSSVQTKDDLSKS